MPCDGDCDGNQQVTVEELVIGINISLGNLPLTACARIDANGDLSVTIDELIRALNNALSGCPVETSEQGRSSEPRPQALQARTFVPLSPGALHKKPRHGAMGASHPRHRQELKLLAQ